MTDKERLDKEMLPHVKSGLLATVLETESFTFYRLANTGYVLFLHGLVNQTTNLSIGYNLKGNEFDIIMHYPFKKTFMKLNAESVERGEKRGFVMTDEITKKFTELKNRVDAMPENPYINFALEAELIEIAHKALAKDTPFKKLRRNFF